MNTKGMVSIFQKMFLKIVWNKCTRSITLMVLSKALIRKKQVMCVCWGGAKYNCNPKAITDKMIEKGLLSTQKGYNVTYAFLNPKEYIYVLPKEINYVLLICIFDLSFS